MRVSSTELQNNFEKYLLLAAKEEIIVTQNGLPVAKLSALEETVAEKAKLYLPSGSVTYEEFLELTKDSEDRLELIDGEIYLLSSPKTAHQYALTELLVQFYAWFKGSGCSVFSAPYDITLERESGSKNVVQPDLMVICDLKERLGEDGYYKGIPELVVEIISETTRSKDLIRKLDLYMSTGIKEYWVVNPLNRELTVYQFADKEISNSRTFRQQETASSYIFDSLEVELNSLFMQ